MQLRVDRRRTGKVCCTYFDCDLARDDPPGTNGSSSSRSIFLARFGDAPIQLPLDLRVLLTAEASAASLAYIATPNF